MTKAQLYSKFQEELENNEIEDILKHMFNFFNTNELEEFLDHIKNEKN